MKKKNDYLEKKILIIGPYPPPIGGLSIHLKRFGYFLKEKNKESFAIFDDSKQSGCETKNLPYLYSGNKILFLFKMLLFNKSKIIHYHSHNWIIRFLLIIIGRVNNSKVCFTFHSFRDDIENFNMLKKAIARLVLRQGDHFIAVSDNEKIKLIKYGCNQEKISIIPAFIAPTYDANESKTPNLVKGFIQKHDFIITANASGTRVYKGEDLYGIDMCIDLLFSLKQQGRNNVGFVFFLPQIEDNNYYHKLNEKIEYLNLRDSFLFVTEKVEMHPIIKLASIFIRPTNTDGDAISVREALSFGVPTIASDVVKRPEGTILFKTRDQGDLFEKVNKIITNNHHNKRILSDVNINTYAEEVYNVYKILLKN